MKKSTIYALGACAFLASAIAGIASCSSEDSPALAPAGDGNVTITATIPADLATRAFGNGLQAKKLSYAVYNSGSSTPITGMIVDGDDAISMSGLTASISLKLVTGRSYDIILWAESEATHSAVNKPYTITWDGQTLDVDYSAISSNDETRDAFYVMHTINVNGPISEEIVLQRPFAQVNFGTDDLLEDAVADTYGSDLMTALSTKVYTTLNLASGEVSNQKDVTFNFAAIPTGEDFPYKKDTYSYLSMNYLLVPTTRSIEDLSFAVKNAEKVINTITVSAAPLQRNFRTNIFGSLLTSTADFDIRIDPIFTTPDNNLPQE